MAKVTITPLTTLSNSLSAVSTINTNFSRIATALEKTLSRDGTAPNNMTADIDLNNNDLLNVGYVQANDIMVGGITLTDRLDYIIEVGENVANADLQIAQFVNEAKVAKDASQAAAQISIDSATDAVEAVLSIGTSVEDAGAAAMASAASAVESAGSATASAGSATAAQGSATAASGSATAAAGSASAASTSATNAAAQVTLAANQVALATTQAGNAATSATNASNSATTAQGHAEAAADQVDYAQEWAQNPQDVPVSVEAGGDGATTFSALHWALEAAEIVGFDPALYYTKVEVDTILVDYAELSNLATVATTGVYSDLTGKPTLGTAAAQDISAFATAAQGTLASTAVQPAAIANMLETSDIGVTVQAYDVDTAKVDVTQTWTAAQTFNQTTGALIAIAALDINCALGNNFSKTIAANTAFTISNIPPSGVYDLRLIIIYTSGTVTWFPNVHWVNDTAPTFTAGKRYEIIFSTRNGGVNWGAASGEYTV